MKFVKIDFVSDITCPWCAIGLHSLEQALVRVGNDLRAELRLHPFELNPDIPPEGEDIVEYAARKYGATADELTERQALIRQRGAAVGLRFGTRTRVWNTFDAHRLLHWAGSEGRRRELKHALFASYHTRSENPGDHDVLLRAAAEVGLDIERAREVLNGSEFSDELRAELQHWRSLGIQVVPTIIVDERLLIQGGYPPEAFEQMLREIAAGLTPA